MQVDLLLRFVITSNRGYQREIVVMFVWARALRRESFKEYQQLITIRALSDDKQCLPPRDVRFGCSGGRFAT